MQVAGDAFPFGNGSELLDLFLCHAKFGVRSLLPGDEGVAHPNDAHQKDC
jgi:hypothetical protein